jgi:hypothetical protein
MPDFLDLYPGVYDQILRRLREDSPEYGLRIMLAITEEETSFSFAANDPAVPCAHLLLDFLNGQSTLHTPETLRETLQFLQAQVTAGEDKEGV